MRSVQLTVIFSLVVLGGLGFTDAASAQPAAAGLWPTVTEPALPIVGSGPRPLASAAVEIAPTFPLSRRSVLLEILGITRTITTWEAALRPPPPQAPTIDVPATWYLPVTDQLSDPTLKDKVLSKTTGTKTGKDTGKDTGKVTGTDTGK